MKKLLTIVSAALVATVGAMASNQRNVYLYKSDGTINVYTPEQVECMTFSGANLFTITNSADESTLTTHSFDATVNAAWNETDKTLDTAIEVGLCYSSENKEPTVDDTCIELGDEVGTYSVTVRKLVPSTTFYFRGYVKLLNEVYYGEAASIKTVDAYVIDGHNFKDLGLPSGMLWAETNIGADYDYEIGEYFAWAETSTKEEYSRQNYSWGYKNPTKYNTSDGNTTLEASDDAAIKAWGENVHTPSTTDCQELIDKCTWTWQDNYYGAKGYLVEGPNGNTIFLSLTGTFIDTLKNQDSQAGYWANSVTSSDVDHADRLYFNKKDNTSIAVNDTYRYYGVAVRAVASKPTK